jgi:enamine deaminase RidA (YjgF/YER057c/UK114 family)
MSPEAKLKEKGYTLQNVELNAGRLMHAKRTGNLIYTSGQVSRWGDQQIKGKVGKDISVEEGYEAAKLCTLNCLQAVKTLAGSLDNVVQVVKVFGMVNVAPDFNNTPAVIHGCSDLLIEIFGENGRHARSAIGLTVPDNWACEIEIIFEVKA